MSNKKALLLFLFPVFVSFLLHVHVLSSDVIGYHVWRQSQTQTVIYHFTFTDSSIFHPQRFDLSNGSTRLLYEFPLYQWLVAQVNRCIGYSLLNTRLFTFLIFIFLLFGFYKLLRHFVQKEIALMGNALLCFSPLLYYYCINPLPDLFALALGIWSLHYFFCFIKKESWSPFGLFAFFLMLAALVKLPFLLFGGVYGLYFFRKIKLRSLTHLPWQILTLLFSFVPINLWYSQAIPTWKNNELAAGIFKSEKSVFQYLDYFQFHLFSSVPELISNYAAFLFLVVGIYYFFKRCETLSHTQGYFIVLFFLLSLYFFYELNMIEKVHDYYLMPFVPLIFLVITYGLKELYAKWKHKWIYLILLIVPLTAWLRIDGRWNRINPGFNPDYLNQTAQLQALIPKEGICVIDYDDSRFIALYYLKRYGYSLNENELSLEKLNTLYEKGAQYLITENSAFSPDAFSGFKFDLLFSKQLKIYKFTRL